MLRLECLEFAEELVVLGVRDGRRIEHVVGVVGLIDLLAEGGGTLAPCRRRRRGHRPVASCVITVMVTPTRRSISSALARASRLSLHGPCLSAEGVQQPAEVAQDRHPLAVLGASSRLVTHPLLEPLEPVRVAQRLGGQVGHDPAELDVGLAERGPVAEGAQEDGADGNRPPRDRVPR